MDERFLNSNLFSKMIYDEATRSDSHFNHLSVFLLPNKMGGSQTRLNLVFLVQSYQLLSFLDEMNPKGFLHVLASSQ